MKTTHQSISISFILFFFGIVLSAKAQYVFPTDTVHYSRADTCGLYLDTSRETTTRPIYCYNGQLSGRRFIRYIITSPIEVYGLAGTVTTDTLIPLIGEYGYTRRPWHAEGSGLFLMRQRKGDLYTIDSILLDSLPLPTRCFHYDTFPRFDPTARESFYKYCTYPLTEGSFPEGRIYRFGIKSESNPKGTDTIWVGYGYDNFERHWGLHDHEAFNMYWLGGYYNPQIKIADQNSAGCTFYDLPADHETYWGGVFLKTREVPDSVLGCIAPRNLRVDMPGEDCVTLLWSTRSNQQAWEIRVRKENGSFDTAHVVYSATPFATLCGLQHDTTYFVQVRSVCEYDVYSAWSDSISFVIKPNAISSPLDDITALLISPLPAKDNLHITATFGLKGVELFDLKGRKLLEKWHEKNFADNFDNINLSLDVSHLASGVYIAVVHTLQGIETRKIVIKK